MNPNLLTALGTLGAGFSAYGQEKVRKDALARALEEQQFERGRLQEQDRLRREAIQRDIEEADLERKRQTERDVLDAIMGGLRPRGMSSMSVGGREFDLPTMLTPEERLNQYTGLWQQAYRKLNPAQARLMALGLLRPGEALVDPGTLRYGPVGGSAPAPTGARTMFQQNFGVPNP